MFRVLAFTVKPCESPDSRYRILQYRSLAKDQDIVIDYRSLMGSKYYWWQIRNEQLLLRVLLYPFLLAIRLWQVLFLAPTYDAIWISREMAPFGPPLLERLLIRLCKRTVLDVDDALHVSDKETSRLLPRLLRDRGKFGRVAGSYSAVVCGSTYLAEFYSQYASDVYVIPTVVDSSRYSRIEPSTSKIVRIGWIGTPLHWHNLNTLRDAFLELAKEREFELVIVGLNQPLGWPLECIRYVKWTLQDELSYFSGFDIGIMPLRDSPFARGKCAFKLIQYMAAGLPVVASPVGANRDVVIYGTNGFLAESADEWRKVLRTLIDDPHLRQRMGKNGRELIGRSYSMHGMWPRYASILTGVPAQEPTCAH